MKKEDSIRLKVEWDTRKSDVEVAILVHGAAEGVSVVALAARETTDGKNRDVQVAQSAAASQDVAQKSIRCGLGVAARGGGSLGARRNATVVDAGVVVGWDGSDGWDLMLLGDGAGDESWGWGGLDAVVGGLGWVLVWVASWLEHLLQSKAVEESALGWGLLLLIRGRGLGVLLGERLWLASKEVVGREAAETALGLSISIASSRSGQAASEELVGDASRNGGGASQDREEGVVLHCGGVVVVVVVVMVVGVINE